ncbi:HPP family protein [Desulfonatronum thioautotrophicum]|uniref:HPP family protein n=1 Tax=Desulfonatronum thioautotrophicum TaxID=617001 RepID=UPI00069C8845|nr:HPP family protein [Desulfonatronum thioautotrophicum]
MVIVRMHLTKNLHSPGGATALITVIGGESVHDLGYLFVFLPVGVGAAILLIVALIVNNIPQNRC